MNTGRDVRVLCGALVLAVAAGVSTLSQSQTPAAAPAAGRGGQVRGGAPVPDPSKPQLFTIAGGTKARYRVQEQLAGINFPSEAVGTTETVAGSIAVNPDGSIGAQSKLVVDLRTITTDQSMRDGYVRSRVLETDKFPMLELTPKRAVGLPTPLPAGAQAQAGFQLVTDITLHGVTREMTWNVVVTFGSDAVNGRATTSVGFAAFKLTKPSLARLMSVDDTIHLEIAFRTMRSVP